jgi:protein-disulfide isomerase
MTAHLERMLQPPVQPSDHAMGRADAPVTLVEYGDFQCPYCFQAHPIVVALQEKLGATLRFVFRNFPLTQLHEHALHAAEAAECVAVHSGDAAYWKMHHAIFEHQQDSIGALDDAHLARYAAQSGGDAEQLKTHLERGTHVERVRSDFESGVRSGVNGTPTFFINGVRFEGNWTDARAFASAIEAAARTNA